MLDFDLGTLRLFVRIAAIGAIARAGQELGYSSTTSSRRIQALESQLGCTLFNRTTRFVALSADGERFLAHAKEILQAADNAVNDLQEEGVVLDGELRVTASASFGRRYIAPHIAEFLSSHPKLSINLELSDSVFDIVQHGFDLALRIGTLEPSSLMARKISDNPRNLVASPAYLAQHGAPQRPKDLLHHNCVSLNEDRNWTLRDKMGVCSQIKTHGNFTTSYGEAITEAILSGTGIALKSRWDVLEHVEDGSLVVVLPDYSIEPEWSIWAVRPPGRMVASRVRLFTEFIEKKIAGVLDGANKNF